MNLSIIIPAHNEAEQIAQSLVPLQSFRARGAEVIVVDGGSNDQTVSQSEPLADRVVISPKGRATQMNAGATVARGGVLLFLHADSILPNNADLLIASAIESGQTWGRFDVNIRGTHFMLSIVAWFMNRRSRLSGISTGDQGLFVTRPAFDRVGGFPSQPLMEDVEICKRLRKLTPPACLSARLSTSGRRWEKNGVWRTIFLMWKLRFQYWRGANPGELYGIYYGS
ncbi:MAG: TIGR04283 family arsenosugar biosynthesis glycosyltransferase [Rhodocyclaceae bacterium]|jgi:rSAM/selenodomain-associated transferase 2|nr:TIGR04283 family arsenosugar biosynthesis glycosyltransferase [Rhodocyclaceae bacterium]MCE2723481.1 TIGR04283 family arsenosugar biosynthesis glycosyltransferase [Betaproteobacteria bacterium]MCA3020039.1 TIGR04283 family arsenosugar biosynthesis glycosyltransferase [Rhodocyclaceae bacterium]MCA3023629.1 TIGR04283 family arsenosugar biosynthesis glycosyltransferase [Rhodocyclaceae bacterium]MCA3026768.1 TIGR04283 family arsenosugar biosynthesis glycosyltransferase [Rhodocyclaceae bacterium]